MSHGKHLACCVGDHSGRIVRDVAPDRTPVTFFHEDGRVWNVVDLPNRILDAYRKLARREHTGINYLLSAAFVEAAQKLLDETE